MIFQLNEDIAFPDAGLAEEDGLLAIGGDLSPKRLVMAYRLGIFPWYSEETPILWYSPHQRFVLFCNELKISKSLRQVLNSGKFKVTLNQAFSSVIEACASTPRKGQNGTWITDEMKEAYIKLHQLGFAHSVEVWYNHELAGGLYGVVVNEAFCGESMFSRVSNTSKAALAFLCRSGSFKMIDCQIYSEHLQRMGARLISREEYLTVLNSGK